jgi:hypothetical protein
MGIIPLSKPVADYIRQFGLTSICRYRDGRLSVTRDPTGADRAWWLHAEQAGAVLKAARRDGGNIEAAARKAGVELADHGAVLARSEAAVAKIQAGLQRAQKSGVLHEFNAEYRRRRLEAARQGRRFMSYRAAKARLQRVLTRIAATGVAPEAIVRTVFDGLH